MRTKWAVGLLLITLVLCHRAMAERRNRKFPEQDYANALERKMIEASFTGKIDVVKDCLAKGARIDARYGGDTKFFKSPDGGWPISAFNWTVLMAATEADRFEIAELLVSKARNLKLDDGWGATPLYVLGEKRTLRKEYDKLAVLFLKNGASANAKTDVYIDGPGNNTVLHRAVCWGHVEIVKSLVAAGADVNAQSSWGDTPLDDVMEGRNDRAIRAILIKAGGKHGSKRKDKESNPNPK